MPASATRSSAIGAPASSSSARCPNVHVKLGGLGMRVFGFEFGARPQPPSSDELAAAWRPYVVTCIEAFGAERCMFESNFPVDKGSCSYRVLWNASSGSSPALRADEKAPCSAGRRRRFTGWREQTDHVGQSQRERSSVDHMERRRIGRTALNVPALGFGGATLGRCPRRHPGASGPGGARSGLCGRHRLLRYLALVRQRQERATVRRGPAEQAPRTPSS